MAISVAEAKAVSDDVASVLNASRKQLGDITNQINALTSKIGSVQTAFAAKIAAIDKMAADNPNDPVWQFGKRVKDDYLAEAAELVQKANALKAAIQNV